MKLLDAFLKTRELLEKSWAPHVRTCGETFCLVEGLSHVAPAEYVSARELALQLLPGVESLGEWNDTHTKEEVLALIDKCIVRCYILEMIEKLKSGWCTNGYATDVHGHTCAAERPEAACWCVDGALMNVGLSRGPEFYNNYAAIVDDELRNKMLPGVYLPSWNDHPKNTQANVVESIERYLETGEQINWPEEISYV